MAKAKKSGRPITYNYDRETDTHWVYVDPKTGEEISLPKPPYPTEEDGDG